MIIFPCKEDLMSYKILVSTIVTAGRWRALSYTNSINWYDFQQSVITVSVLVGWSVGVFLWIIFLTSLWMRQDMLWSFSHLCGWGRTCCGVRDHHQCGRWAATLTQMRVYSICQQYVL